MAVVKALSDTFRGNTIDSSKWTESVAGSMTISHDSSGVTMNYPSSSTSATIGDELSVNQYDLTGSDVTLKVAAIPASGTAADTTFGLLASGVANNRVQWITESGNLQAQSFVAGVKTNQGAQINGISMPIWLRIRESGGTTFWDTSSDGIAWTNRASVANPITLTSLQVRLEGSCFQNETNPGTWKFLLYNIFDQIPLAGRVPARRRPSNVRRRRMRSEIPVGASPQVDNIRQARARRSGAVRRPRARAEVVPVVAASTAPAWPVDAYHQRRIRGLLRRARMRVETVPPQFNPTMPVDANHQPHRPRGFFSRKVRMRVEVTPPQFNPTMPVDANHQPHRPRGFLRRKGQTREVVPEQSRPIDAQHQPRRPRGFLRRKGQEREVTPPQFNPTLPIDANHQPHRIRGVPWRLRARSREAPITQAVPGPPPWPVDAYHQPHRPRGLTGRRKGRTAEVVTPQQNPTMPINPGLHQPRRPRGFLRRRGQVREIVRAQLNPTMPVDENHQRRRIWNLLRRKGRVAEVVQTPPVVPYTPEIRVF